MGVRKCKNYFIGLPKNILNFDFASFFLSILSHLLLSYNCNLFDAGVADTGVKNVLTIG